MMNYGVYLPNFGVFGQARVMAELAQLAESAGWDGFFIWDHIARDWVTDVVDPWVALSACAMTTKTIKLGAMVTPMPRRRPWKLARETVSLDYLSDGRLIFGAGLGSGRGSEWSNLGEETVPRVRGKMLDEGLAILNGLWTADSFTYEGVHYSVSESTFYPKPLQQPRIPVWIAGNTPNKIPMKRAAKWDGVFPILTGDPDDVDGLVAQLQWVTERMEDYRDDKTHPFDIVHLGPPTPGDDKSRALEIVAPFRKTGMTWWLENIAPWRFGFDWMQAWDFAVMRERIAQGPPRV